MLNESIELGAWGEAVRYLAVRLTRDIQTLKEPDAQRNLYNTFATTLSYPPLAMFDESTVRRVMELMRAAETTSGTSVNVDGQGLPLYYDYVVNYAIGLRLHLADKGAWEHLCRIIEETRDSVRASMFLLNQQGERLTAEVKDPVFVLLVVMYEAVAQVNIAVSNMEVGGR